MLNTQQLMLTTSCTASVSENDFEYNIANGIANDNYVIVGAHGFPTDNVDGVRAAYHIRTAVLAAQDALKHPDQWNDAADLFDTLVPMTNPVPGEDTMTINKCVNLSAVADNAPKLAAASRAAAMYYNVSNHSSIDAMHQMATHARVAHPFHIIDAGKINARYHALRCEAAFDDAAAALADDKVESDPHGAAAAYQTAIATAEIAYNLMYGLDKGMVTPELKQLRATAGDRITHTYSATYPSILKQVGTSYQM